ncbi:MAG: hypothetical protein LBD42_04730 [Desulfovibrio sp.]|nr:hypothetical protein [Desulfovibrio sp.]
MEAIKENGKMYIFRQTLSNHEQEMITMRKIMMFLFAIAAFGMGGCASKHMDVVTVGQNESTLADGQSAIVFFRDTVFGGAIQAPIVEAKTSGLNTDVSFVGIVSASTKILHKTTPGKHVYVVGGELSRRLEADLAPNKFYYVRVDPRMGVFKASFAFEPILANDEKLQKALSGCNWVKPGATANEWFISNKEGMKEKAEKSAERSDNNKAFLTPGQGFDALVR